MGGIVIAALASALTATGFLVFSVNQPPATPGPVYELPMPSKGVQYQETLPEGGFVNRDAVSDDVVSVGFSFAPKSITAEIPFAMGQTRIVDAMTGDLVGIRLDLEVDVPGITSRTELVVRSITYDPVLGAVEFEDARLASDGPGNSDCDLKIIVNPGDQSITLTCNPNAACTGNEDCRLLRNGVPLMDMEEDGFASDPPPPATFECECV